MWEQLSAAAEPSGQAGARQDGNLSKQDSYTVVSDPKMGAGWTEQQINTTVPHEMRTSQDQGS